MKYEPHHFHTKIKHSMQIYTHTYIYIFSYTTSKEGELCKKKKIQKVSPTKNKKNLYDFPLEMNTRTPPKIPMFRPIFLR